MWAPGVLTFFFSPFFFAVHSNALPAHFDKRTVSDLGFTSSQWIWSQSTDLVQFASFDVHVFRKTYTAPLGKSAESAILLLCSADPLSALNVNDKVILSTRHAALEKCSTVQRFEVPAMSNNNANTFTVQTSDTMAGILAAIQITLNDGTQENLVSDATWQVQQITPGSSYDSEAAWSSAVVVTEPQNDESLDAAAYIVSASTTTAHSSKPISSHVSTMSSASSASITDSASSSNPVTSTLLPVSTASTILSSSISSSTSSVLIHGGESVVEASSAEPLLTQSTTVIAQALQSAPAAESSPLDPPPAQSGSLGDSGTPKTVIFGIVGGVIFGLVVIGVSIYIGMMFYRKKNGPQSSYVDIEGPENPYSGPRFVVEPFKLYQADIKPSAARGPSSVR